MKLLLVCVLKASDVCLVLLIATCKQVHHLLYHSLNVLHATGTFSFYLPGFKISR